MKNIVLTLRVTPERAARIVGRLYGSGDIDLARYKWHMERINADALALENARNDRRRQLMENATKQFYKTKKTTAKTVNMGV